MVDLKVQPTSFMRRDLIFEDNDFILISKDKDIFAQGIDITTNVIRGDLKYNINSGMDIESILEDKTDIFNSTQIQSFLFTSYQDVFNFYDCIDIQTVFDEINSTIIIDYTVISIDQTIVNQTTTLGL